MLAALAVAVYLFLLGAFVWLVYNVTAIRKMLENQGMFSGEVCGRCRMPIPEGADVCGHCGRDQVPGPALN
jgi:hypothetical protein